MFGFLIKWVSIHNNKITPEIDPFKTITKLLNIKSALIIFNIVSIKNTIKKGECKPNCVNP
jgi:hypothetical protein